MTRKEWGDYIFNAVLELEYRDNCKPTTELLDTIMSMQDICITEAIRNGAGKPQPKSESETK